MGDEWDRVRQALREAGARGVEDFGRFINNTKYFEPSRLGCMSFSTTCPTDKLPTTHGGS